MVTSAPLDIETLRAMVADGSVDTVIVALTDMQGRLQGKRLHAPYFLDEVLANGTEACNYLLAVDTDMNTVDGYALTSWESGYGDFVLVPDMATLRLVPWQPATCLVLADVAHVADGSPVTVSPRQVLRAALSRLEPLGWTCLAGTELEFIVFEGSYENAWDGGYRSLVPANRYNVDYSVLGTSRVEPLLRDIRNGMYAAGLTVESAKGECNPGQHEITFRYADALRTADQHVIYKTGAKEIAAGHGYSLTFMAKVNAAEGNSCHIHISFRETESSGTGGEPSGESGSKASGVSGGEASRDVDRTGNEGVRSAAGGTPATAAGTPSPVHGSSSAAVHGIAGAAVHGDSGGAVHGTGGAAVMAGDGPYGLSETGASILAGIQAGLRELTLMFAPTINSYKRYQPGSFAPTAIAWGPDNRTCALRLVGHGPSLRLEVRVPGADVNPYLAVAALIHAAADGVARKLTMPAPVTGNAYALTDVARVPSSLEEALELWTSSALARDAFGKDVVDHYANMAQVEINAYRSAITDWELRRYFERI